MLTVDRIHQDKDSLYNFAEVLMARDEDKVFVGKPTLKNVKVTGTITEHLKGDKIKISKFKAKVRYRRNTGFRPLQTSIRIDKIFIGQEKTVPEAKHGSTKNLPIIRETSS